MKRLLPLLSCALLAAAAPSAFGQAPGSGARFGFELRLGGVALDDDGWDDSVGGFGDIGLMAWDSREIFGLWIGVGGQGATYRWKDDWGEVESDILAVPFGASVLLRGDLGGGIALRAEAGARYVSMDIDDWDDDHYHHHHRRLYDDRDRYYHPDRYLDVDDTSLAVVALQLEFDLAPARIAVGGGYQFDLGKPDLSYLDETIGEIDLSGAMFFFSVGVVF